MWKVAKILCAASLAVLTGCASTEPAVNAKAEIGDPMVARGSVAVVPDVSMADGAEASHLVALVSQALKDADFRVKTSPDEADVIAIPSLAYSTPTVDAAETTGFSRDGFQPPTVGNQSGMTYSTFSFSSLDEIRTPAPSVAPQKCGLRITAVTRKDWFDTDKTRNVERVWRVIVVTPTDARSQDEIVAALMQAATAKLRAIQAVAKGDAPAPAVSR